MSKSIVRILALESSVAPGTIATLAGDRVLEQRQLESDRRTTRALTPALAGLLADQGWKPADVQLVAVTTGPGSFTGLRVAVTTAKTFTYATGCAVLGVHTMRVIAEQTRLSLPTPSASSAARTIHVVMDAQRGELFVGRFQLAAGQVTWNEVVELQDQADWLASVPREAIVSGPVLDKLAARLPDDSVADRGAWWPQAATVGRVAWCDYQAGRRDDVWTVAPVYYRRSAAEEKLPTIEPPPGFIMG